MARNNESSLYKKCFVNELELFESVPAAVGLELATKATYDKELQKEIGV
jgi:hypothetical protein